MKTDLDRAIEAIAFFGLRGPHDGPGEFTFPKEREELADFVYDVADEHAARAVLMAPRKFKIFY